MNGFLAIGYLISVAWGVFPLRYFGSIDPHNLRATPSRLSIGAKTFETMSAIVKSQSADPQRTLL